MKKPDLQSDFQDGLKLLTAILVQDQEYIEAFLEANPQRVIPDTFHKYELEKKDETAHINFFELYHFNLFEVASVYGHSRLADRFALSKQQLSHDTNRLIERLVKVCSLLIEDNIDGLSKWGSYEGSLTDCVIPSGFAAARFPSQPTFTGIATLLDLALIWNQPKAIALLEQKGSYISFATISNLKNASTDQTNILKRQKYFTGAMIFENPYHHQSAHRGSKPKKIKEIVPFDDRKMATEALRDCNIKMVLALYQYNPSSITTKQKFMDPLIEAFSHYIEYNRFGDESLLTALFCPPVKLANDTAERLLSKLNNSRNQLSGEQTERAKKVLDGITKSNPDQNLTGKLIVTYLTGNLSDIVGYMLPLLSGVDFTATYSYPGKNIKATLLEMAERHAPQYVKALKSKIMEPQHASEANGDLSITNAGDYEVIQFKDLTLNKKLGEGAFAAVYQGQWDGATVAVKAINATKASTGTLQSLMIETKLLSRLHHPHITQYFGVCKTRDHFYFVMELMLAGDLMALVHKERLSVDTKLAFSRQILTALIYLHKKHIIHRDLKPENVLVDGNKTHVKLGDFGIAVNQELGDTVFVPERTPGTAFYMSPEVVLQNPAHYSDKSDMYSFAMLLFMIMTESSYNQGVEEIIEMLLQGKRPELKEDKIPKNVASLITFCWQGGPSAPKPSLNGRFSAVQALEYFDSNIQPK